jgi:hypothetical protein
MVTRNEDFNAAHDEAYHKLAACCDGKKGIIWVPTRLSILRSRRLRRTGARIASVGKIRINLYLVLKKNIWLKL